MRSNGNAGDAHLLGELARAISIQCHAAIVHTRHTSRLVRQQRLDHAPLKVGQIISPHADPESAFGRQGKVAAVGQEATLAGREQDDER